MPCHAGHHSIQTLRTLSLRSNKLSAEGGKSLADALKTNQVWSILYCDTLACFLCIFPFQTLQTLNLPHNKLHAEGLNHLADGLKVNQVRWNISGNNFSYPTPICSDTPHSRSAVQWNGCRRRKISSWCLDSQLCEKNYMKEALIAIVIDVLRHFTLSIYNAIN